MLNPFEFATAGRIVFGAGKLKELPAVMRPFGRRVLLVVGSSLQRAQPVVQMLEETGIDVATFHVAGEPSIELVEQGASLARENNSEVVVGFGGGSVIDAAKAISALSRNREPVTSYLEVIGDGKPLTEMPLPFIAIPTTSGTGAEVTRNAVLHSAEHNVKVSLRSPMMLPTIALVDPEVSLSLPPRITAETGMDALTQLIEPFLSCRANPMTDAICREALPKVAGALERVFTHGEDLAARTDMAFGSLSSGLGLANAGLGAVHGFAAPIGGMFDAPHGVVCAALLPAVLKMNWHRIAGDGSKSHYHKRYLELARMITGDPGAPPQNAIEWVTELRERLEIRGLDAFGVGSSDFPLIAQKAACASSMKGNPVKLSQAELIEVLKESACGCSTIE